MSAHSLVVEEVPVWWRRHCLQNCEEFRVERAGRLLGFVEEIEWAEVDEPSSLVIECRGGEPTHVRVASADVVDVAPGRCLVTLRPRAHVLPIPRRAMTALTGSANATIGMT